MKQFKVSLSFAIALLILILSLLLSGCGGGGGGGSTTSNPNTFTEITSTQRTISPNEGGEIDHEGAKVVIPPNALPEEITVKIATVTSRDSNNTMFKLANITNQTVILSEPLTITIPTEQRTRESQNQVCFWTPYGWLPLNSTLDNVTGTLSFQLRFIPPDLSRTEIIRNKEKNNTKDNTMIDFVVLNPLIFTGMANILWSSESSDNFIIFYQNIDDDFAKKIISFCKNAYYYQTDEAYLNYPKPDFFSLDTYNIYTANLPDNVVGVTFSTFPGMILIDITKLKVNNNIDEDAYENICAHEFFHLIQFTMNIFNESWRWFMEDSANAIGYYASGDCQKLQNYNRSEFFDLFFFHSQFDSEYATYPYLSYIIKKFGHLYARNILQSVRQSHRNLSSFDSILRNQLPLNRGVADIIWESMEDYVISGTVFNNNNFQNLYYRAEGQPFYYALSQELNIERRTDIFEYTLSNQFSEQKELPHASADFEHFYCNGKNGIANIYIRPQDNDYTVKVYYLKENSGIFNEVGMDIATFSSPLVKSINIGDTITDIIIIFVNESLTDNSSAECNLYTESSVTLTSINITPEGSIKLSPSQTQQFTATGHYSDDSTSNITNQVTWNCDNSDAGSINNNGLFTAATNVIGTQTAHITATKDGKTSNTATVTVTTGMEFITIPAGEFTMGSLSSEGFSEERPQHTVYLDSYQIGKYEVTNAQLAQFITATGYTPQGDWRHFPAGSNPTPAGYPENYPNHPVINVSWNDAKAFCDWAGYRLPTEAQWEKAARGADARRFPWGNIYDYRMCNNFENAYMPGELNIEYNRGTMLVGSFPSGASPYGLMDMSGNVWEWCSDWMQNDYYSVSPYVNPTGPTSGSYKVARGGSWLGYGAADPGFVPINDFRCVRRASGDPSGWSYGIGFRCAR